MGRSNAGAKNAASVGPEIPSGVDAVQGGVATGVDAAISVIEGTVAKANGAEAAATIANRAFAGVFGVLGVGIAMLSAAKQGKSPATIAQAGFAAGSGALAGFGAGLLVGAAFGSVPGAFIGGAFGLVVGALFSPVEKPVGRISKA